MLYDGRGLLTPTKLSRGLEFGVTLAELDGSNEVFGCLLQVPTTCRRRAWSAPTESTSVQRLQRRPPMVVSDEERYPLLVARCSITALR